MDLLYGIPEADKYIAAKINEKVTKYRQLAFELRERRTGYKITIFPVVIGACGRGMKEVLRDVKRVFNLANIQNESD